MAGCKTENWTVQDISDALQNNHRDNKRIVVPMFQRGQRWTRRQQQTFIDSLIKGYPVGTLLFYEKYENGQWYYILVDGLQRGSCIRSYMTNPTAFFFNENIPENICSGILDIIGKNENANYAIVRSVLTDFIKEQKSYKNIQFYEVAIRIFQKFEIPMNYETIGKITNLVSLFFRGRQELYYVFGCKDETTMIRLPISLIEENLERLNFSVDEDGNITHWHIVFFQSSDGHITWLLSKPSIQEVSVDEYRM